jgi:hypothetical protein
MGAVYGKTTVMSSLTQRNRALEGQLNLYNKQVENWKQEHDRAMDCYELQTILSFGLHIYNNIREIADAWADAVRRGVTPNRLEDAERVREWFAWWIKPCDGLEAEIKQLRDEGYSVDHAQEFQEACLDARSVLNFSLDRLYAKDEDSGRKTMGEIRRALQDRFPQSSR